MASRLKTVALSGLAAALLLIAAGCSNDAGPTASPSSPPSPFVGFWTGSALGEKLLVEIDRVGTAYSAGLDGLPLRAVLVVHGRLLIRRVDTPSGLPSPVPGSLPSISGLKPWHGVELAWERSRVVAVFTQGGKTLASADLRRMTEAEYRRKANEVADQDMRFVALSLYTAAQRWQKSHGGCAPSVAQMNVGSPVEELVPGHQWPMSPYDWTPVHQGTGLGDFTYTTDGTTFKVVGHLSGGKDIVP